MSQEMLNTSPDISPVKSIIMSSQDFSQPSTLQVTDVPESLVAEVEERIAVSGRVRVEGLLRGWAISESNISKLIENDFNTEATLLAVTEEALKEIGVSVGQRCLIIQNVREFKRSSQGVNDLVSSSLQSPFSTPPSQASSAFLTPTHLQHHATPTESEKKQACKRLVDLLEASADPNARILAKSNRLTKGTERRVLTHTIVQHLLEEAHKNDPERCRVSYGELEKWATAVNAQFPDENVEVWFCKQRLDSKGRAAVRGSGKLWEKYNNARKTYVTPDGKHLRSSSERPSVASGSEGEPNAESSSSSSSSASAEKAPPKKARRSLKSLSAYESTEVIKKDLLENEDFKIALEIGSEGTLKSELLKAWRACAQQRLDYLRATTFDEYLAVAYPFAFPVLGPQLVEADFAFLQPKVTDNALLKNLSLLREPIRLLAEHTLSNLPAGPRKDSVRNLIEYFDSGTGDSVELTKSSACLLLLPHIVRGAQSSASTRISALQSSLMVDGCRQKLVSVIIKQFPPILFHEDKLLYYKQYLSQYH